MATIADEILASIERIGRLLLVNGSLEFEGNVRALTPDLRTKIAANKQVLIEALTPTPIAELCGRLCGHGVWAARDGDTVAFREHEAGSLESVDKALISELVARQDELVAFLQKAEDELTDAELDALGYNRSSPGARIFEDSNAPEPAAWTWKPAGSKEEDKYDARCRLCNSWTSRETAKLFAGLCWNCWDNQRIRESAAGS